MLVLVGYRDSKAKAEISARFYASADKVRIAMLESNRADPSVKRIACCIGSKAKMPERA